MIQFLTNIESENLPEKVMNLWIWLTLSGCQPHMSSVLPWSGMPKVHFFNTFLGGLRHMMPPPMSLHKSLCLAWHKQLGFCLWINFQEFQFQCFLILFTNIFVYDAKLGSITCTYNIVNVLLKCLSSFVPCYIVIAKQSISLCLIDFLHPNLPVSLECFFCLVLHQRRQMPALYQVFLLKL